MTECPACHSKYRMQKFDVPNATTLDARRCYQNRTLWRWVLVLGVILVGSLVIWLVDRGTRAFFHLHWNGLDGQLYHWIGLTQVPRFLVYFGVSVLMAAFITGCDTLDLDWCECGGHTSSDGDECGDICAVFGVVVLVCIIFVGFVVMLTAIVGGLGSAIGRRGENRIRSLKVQRKRIANLRPLPRYLVIQPSVPVVVSPSLSMVHVHVTTSGYVYRCACDAPTGVALGHV
ncbi:Aste57867_6105 [Aphanomyces stellatus]|uniref:Aste57867_6105 protein n=1 Tax=Aphanomyces stellatus TaxID=120398 RepID=A0A485KFH6_9STRA|nr:hypothetical protein As57867_006091 [Aphanomyces stellatus]VFT83112.1 Aste57867_6105 [Aphanomyces stellatus]